MRSLALPNAQSLSSTGAYPCLTVLLLSLASLTPFTPSPGSSGFQSSPWLPDCLPSSHSTPFAADFQFHRGERDYWLQNPSPSRILTQNACPFLLEEPFLHLSALVRNPEATPTLRPPVAATLPPSFQGSSTVCFSLSLQPGLCPSPALAIEGPITGLISSHSWLLLVLLLTPSPGSLPSSLELTHPHLSGCSCSVCSELLFLCAVNTDISFSPQLYPLLLDDSYNCGFGNYQILQLRSSG